MKFGEETVDMFCKECHLCGAEIDDLTTCLLCYEEVCSTCIKDYELSMCVQCADTGENISYWAQGE